MNKKIIALISIGIIALVSVGAGVYFLIVLPRTNAASTQEVTDNALNGPNGRGNFANMKNFSGKVLTIGSTDMIVDSGTAQNDVVWDNNTNITGNSTSNQTTVLAIGNTVTVNFTAGSESIKNATIIQKVDLANFGLGTTGTPGQNAQTPGNGGRRSQGGNSQGSQSQNTQGQNGPARQANRTSYIGQVTSVNGNILTISVNNQGFGFGGNTNNTSTTPTPTSMDFDISSATYQISEPKKITDIITGNTLQVTGTLQGNQQILARRIVID